MGSFIVRQPDGKYAMFSTVVDDFTVLNAATPTEAAKQRGNGRGTGPRMFHLCGVLWDQEDPEGDLWTECIGMRACRWREPGWPEMSRMLCDIIDKANAEAAKEQADD